jgi:hypothetical protein
VLLVLRRITSITFISLLLSLFFSRFSSRARGFFFLEICRRYRSAFSLSPPPIPLCGVRPFLLLLRLTSFPPPLSLHLCFLFLFSLCPLSERKSPYPLFSLLLSLVRLCGCACWRWKAKKSPSTIRNCFYYHNYYRLLVCINTCLSVSDRTLLYVFLFL